MAINRGDNFPPYGMECPRCNDLLIAPVWSGYVCEYKIRYFWYCENCSHEVEMVLHLSTSQSSKVSGRYGACSLPQS
jgi:hypothetical protein